MTNEEKHITVRYLQDFNFKEKEFFEEMYDHICSSYENREDEQQSISQHIYQVIEPAFGGKRGLKELRSIQARTSSKLVLKRAFQLYGAYLFRWPSILITALLFLLLFQLNQIYSSWELFYYIFQIGVFIPFLLVNAGVWRFKNECKKQNRPYSRSQVNNSIYIFGLSGGLAVDLLSRLINWLAYGSTYGSLDLFIQHPVSVTPVCMFIMIHSLVSLQLFKEKFRVKLV